MTRFILIPGAGADPRVYCETITALEALGHSALAPPLPLGDPDAAPSDHAAAILGAVAPEPGTVVVAQSLGAFTGPLVAGDLDAALILLAPMIPSPGETAGEWWEATGHAAAIAQLTERLGPMGAWGEAEMAEVFLHDVTPDVIGATAGDNGPPGPGMFAEPWPLPAWPAVPTQVLAPTGDRLFPLAFQRRIARERLGAPVATMPGGHLPMLSRPRELARRLVELAGAH